jgi:hypothetical protein
MENELRVSLSLPGQRPSARVRKTARMSERALLSISHGKRRNPRNPPVRQSFLSAKINAEDSVTKSRMFEYAVVTDMSNGLKDGDCSSSYEGHNAVKPDSMISILFDFANQSQFRQIQIWPRSQSQFPENEPV